MPQLQGLPPELLLAIASHVPELRDLAFTCRHVNQVVTPLLYESVVYRQEGIQFYQNEYIQVVSRGSEIFNLDAFTRSLRSSESLRSLVKSVDLRWHNTDMGFEDDVCRCLQILEPSCLRTLHLAPANLFFEIPTGLGVTLLAFRREWHELPKHGTDLDRLYTLFCIPSLIHFVLDGWGYGNFSGVDRVNQSRVGISNVETATLENSRISASDLQRLLSWPKTLKALTFHGASITSRELHHSLQHQRLTLEYLDARGTDERDSKNSTSNTGLCTKC